MPLLHENSSYESPNPLIDQLWKAYREVNQTIIGEVLKNKKENDLIWVHDLLLGSLLLKKQDMSTNVVFHLSMPISNEEVFCRFIYSHEIIKSLLMSDVITLESFVSQSNLVNICSSHYRLESKIKPGGFLSIDNRGRDIILKVITQGVERLNLFTLLSEPDNQIFANNLNAEFLNKGRLILSSVDLLQPMSNIANKMRAYHKFLKRNPNLRQKLTLIQFIFPFDKFNLVDTNDNLNYFVQLV